jgi:SAM-dependent methyltransferase
MIELGRAFADEEVARLYAYRPGYPPETFGILARLIVEPRTILDAGCGRGELARGLVRAATRVDAVDPSRAMIAEGRRLAGADDPRLRWLVARAEDAPLAPPYGLIVCGSSIHWMDPAVVLPRFRDALAPGARVAIAGAEAGRPEGSVGDELLALFQHYSPCHHPTAAVMRELVASGRFVVEGRADTPPIRFTQTVDDYLSELGSTATLSRATLGDRYADWEREFRDLFARHHVASVTREVVGQVAWGRPA